MAFFQYTGHMIHLNRCLWFVLVFGLLLTGLPARGQPHPFPDGVVMPLDMFLRLRATPSTESAILDQLASGTTLRIIGRTADNTWLEVETERYSTGWVYADYVQVFVDLEGVMVRTDAGAALDYGSVVIGDVEAARAVFLRGQQMGSRADVFSKVGDSITVSGHMLHPISRGLYQLGDFIYLQPVIDYFSAATARSSDSFGNTSLAAGVGWSAAAVLDSAYADSELCLPDEPPLSCEYRLVRPALALIMFGTNDVGYRPPAAYRADLERIVQISINAGVLPVLSTLPLRVGYEAQVEQFNQIVRETALAHQMPLWDYARAMATAGRLGLDDDGVHPSIPARGYEGAADFRTWNLHSGYVLRNLTALHVLDVIWREVIIPSGEA